MHDYTVITLAALREVLRRLEANISAESVWHSLQKAEASAAFETAWPAVGDPELIKAVERLVRGGAEGASL